MWRYNLDQLVNSSLDINRDILCFTIFAYDEGVGAGDDLLVVQFEGFSILPETTAIWPFLIDVTIRFLSLFRQLPLINNEETSMRWSIWKPFNNKSISWTGLHILKDVKYLFCLEPSLLQQALDLIMFQQIFHLSFPELEFSKTL